MGFRLGFGGSCSPCCGGGGGGCDPVSLDTVDVELIRSEGNLWHGYRVYKMPDYVVPGNWGGLASFTFNRPSVGTLGNPRYYIGYGNPSDFANDYDVAPNGAVYLPSGSVLKNGQISYVGSSLQANVSFPWSNYYQPLFFKNNPFLYIHWTLSVLQYDATYPTYYAPPSPGDELHSGGPSLDSFKTSVYFGTSTTDPFWRNPPNWKRVKTPYVVSAGTPSISANLAVGIDPLYANLTDTANVDVSDTSKLVTIRTYDSGGTLLDTQTATNTGVVTVPTGTLAPSETDFNLDFEYQWNNTLSGTVDCGVTPPIDDGCWSTCRPAGETRPLKEIHLTVVGERYTCEWGVTETAGSAYKIRYVFPGDTYSGTIVLKPVAGSPGVWRYTYPTCAGCVPYIQAEPDPWNAGECHIYGRFYGLLTPGYYSPPNNTDIEPTCATARPILVENNGTRYLSTLCGGPTQTIVDGQMAAGPYNGRPTPIRNGFYTDNTPVDIGCEGGPYDRVILKGRIAFGSPTEIIPVPGTLAESGGKLMNVTSISTVYG